MTTTTGTGINIRNMTIGNLGFTVRSVTTNGAPNGIFLQNNTGTGGFTIAGTGVAGSGGTIQNGTGANGSTDGIGIYMNNNTHTVSLNWMQLNDFSNFAIRGITVSSVSLSNTVVSGTNGNDAAFDEGSISFDNLTGTSNITNLTVSGGHEDNFRVVNTTGTLTFSMTGSTVRDNTNVSPGNNGLILEANNTANVTAVITGSSFLRNRSNGIQANTNNSGTMDVTIGTLGVANSGGTFTDNNIGVNIAHNSSSTLNFDVQQATFQPVALTSGASPININLGSLGNQMSGNILNNVITNANSPTGPGMRIIGNGAGTMTILVNGNNVSQIGNRGIEVIARDGSNRINATITNNTVTLTEPTLSADGIRADAGATTGDTTSICANISGNTSTTIAGVFGIRVRQRFSTTYQLQGYGGGATDTTAVQNFLSTNNNGATTSADFATGGFTSAVCPTPLLDPTFTENIETDQPGLDQNGSQPTDNNSVDNGSGIPAFVPTLQPTPFVPIVNEGSEQQNNNRAVEAIPGGEEITAEQPAEEETALAPQATTTVGPFTLPAGEQTTITFSVVIQNPFPAAQNPICNQATISGGNFSNVLSDDPDVAGTANPTCTTVQINADLSITKTDGATTEIPGTPIIYTIVASNAGPNPDPAAVVTDNFPATITGVTWTCVGAGGATCTASGSGNINETVNLPVGGSVTFEATGNISAAATGTLANTASVATSAGITDPVPANNSATDSDTLTPTADVSITKTDGQTEDIPGTSIVYTIVATNDGPSNAPLLLVMDTFPATLTGVTWTCTAAGGGTCPASGSGDMSELLSLPVGGTATFTVNAIISASATGTLSNTAIIDTSGITDPDTSNNSSTDTTTLTPEADVVITKTDGQATDIPGTSIAYTIVASNSGPSNAPSVTIADTFPAALTSVTWTCVGAGGGTCTASGSGNINDTANLPAGGSVTYTINATILASATGTLSNTATATVGGGVTDPDPSNNSATDTTTLTPQADVAITKTDGQTSDTPGTSIVYTIVALNSGPSNAPSVSVADTFPAALTGVTWTCVGAGGATCPASGSGDINQFVNLPVGGSVTFTVNATILASATGTLTNVATAIVGGGATDPNGGNNFATDNTTLTPSADVSITKTDGQTTDTPGTTIVYTIVAFNSGPSNAPSVTIADTFPATLTGITWTCVGAGGATCTASGSGNINESVNLPPGGSVTFTVNATILASATGTLSNTATAAVGGGVTDPTPGNNSATDTTTLTPQADLGITKTDGQTSSVAGAPITYTIVVNNIGPSSVSSATVADTFPADLVGMTWTCTGAGGGTCTASGSGNINQTVNLPAGGSVTFTAVGSISGTPVQSVITNTATVSSAVTDPVPGNNSATDTTTLDAPPEITTLNVTPGTINENQAVNLTLVFTDPNIQEPHVVEISWGDGTTNTINLPIGTLNASANHTYLDDNPTGTASDIQNISVTVSEPDGGEDTATTQVTVNNVAPVLSNITLTSAVNEGGVATLSGNITDPGTQDTFTLQVNWGDGTPTQTFNYPAGTTSFNETHTFVDDNPTGTPSDSYNVIVVLNDDDTGGASSGVNFVQVNNVAPTLSGVSATAVNEGGATTLTGSINDPGVQDTFTLQVNWGDGSPVQTFNYPAGTTSFSETHTYTDDNASNSYTIGLTLTDDDTGSDTDSTVVTVNNTAPTLSGVTLTSSVNEGGTATLTGNISDPGTQDTFTLLVNWGDGSPVQGFFYPAGTTSFNETHVYADDNPTGTASDNVSVSLTLSDDDSGTDNDTASITVNNVAPTLSNVTLTAAVNEGGTATLTADVSDPGVQDTFMLVIDWGDGLTQTVNLPAGTTTINQTHVYVDDNPSGTPLDTYTVSYTITDDDTGSDNGSDPLDVANVAPTLSNVAATTINENGTTTLTGLINDPGVEDTFTMVIDWGDGVTETVTYPAGTTSFNENYQYLDDNPTGTPSDSYNISLTLTDDDTGSDSETTTLTVNNVAPELTNLAITAVNETQSNVLTVDINDPGTLDSFEVVIDWGDGFTETVSLPAGTTTLTYTHKYLDDNPSGTPSDTYNVSVTITDDDTGSDTAQTGATVNNVAPAVSNLAVTPLIDENSTVTLTGQITEVNVMDTLTVTVDWGDGTVENVTLTGDVLLANHTYVDDGLLAPEAVFTIEVMATDDDTGTDSATVTTEVNNVAPELTNLAYNSVVNEGEEVLFSADIVEISPADTFTLTVLWGDGESDTFTYGPATTSITFTHLFLDDNPTVTPSDIYTISFTLADDNGGTDISSSNITVNNVAPDLLNVATTSAIDENGTITLTGDILDPGVLDTFGMVIDWGNGVTETVTYPAGTTSFVETHQYLDDDPTATPADTYTINLSLTDDDSGSTSDSAATTTVNNVAPVVDAGNDATAAVSEILSFVGSFTDVGSLDTHTIVWDMGDGTFITGTLTPTHTYTAAGVYTATLTVTDDDTGVGSDQVQVTVIQGATTVYLPVLLSNYLPGPDLVVQSITVSATDVQIVIANIGYDPVPAGLSFWVDLNLNPTTVPTGPNQGWEQIGGEGLIWGVIDANELTPGGTMTLNLSHPYFRADLSNFSGTFANGDEVYVQVDSANTDTTYGAVLERHEVEGTPYNNITAVTVSGVSDATHGVGEVYNGPRPVGQLPPR